MSSTISIRRLLISLVLLHSAIAAPQQEVTSIQTRKESNSNFVPENIQAFVPELIPRQAPAPAAPAPGQPAAQPPAAAPAAQPAPAPGVQTQTQTTTPAKPTTTGSNSILSNADTQLSVEPWKIALGFIGGVVGILFLASIPCIAYCCVHLKQKRRAKKAVINEYQPFNGQMGSMGRTVGGYGQTIGGYGKISGKGYGRI